MPETVCPVICVIGAFLYCLFVWSLCKASARADRMTKEILRREGKIP
jgi:hypothetical protein